MNETTVKHHIQIVKESSDFIYSGYEPVECAKSLVKSLRALENDELADRIEKTAATLPTLLREHRAVQTCEYIACQIDIPTLVKEHNLQPWLPTPADMD